MPGERKKDGLGERAAFWEVNSIWERPNAEAGRTPRCLDKGNWPGGICAWDRNGHHQRTKEAEGAETAQGGLEGEVHVGVRPPWSQATVAENVPDWKHCPAEPSPRLCPLD